MVPFVGSKRGGFAVARPLRILRMLAGSIFMPILAQSGSRAEREDRRAP